MQFEKVIFFNYPIIVSSAGEYFMYWIFFFFFFVSFDRNRKTCYFHQTWRGYWPWKTKQKSYFFPPFILSSALILEPATSRNCVTLKGLKNKLHGLWFYHQVPSQSRMIWDTLAPLNISTHRPTHERIMVRRRGLSM